jgi:hypothetical protein
MTLNKFNVTMIEGAKMNQDQATAPTTYVMWHKEHL